MSGQTYEANTSRPRDPLPRPDTPEDTGTVDDQGNDESGGEHSVAPSQYDAQENDGQPLPYTHDGRYGAGTPHPDMPNRQHSLSYNAYGDPYGGQPPAGASGLYGGQQHLSPYTANYDHYGNSPAPIYGYSSHVAPYRNPTGDDFQYTRPSVYAPCSICRANGYSYCSHTYPHEPPPPSTIYEDEERPEPRTNIVVRGNNTTIYLNSPRDGNDTSGGQPSDVQRSEPRRENVDQGLCYGEPEGDGMITRFLKSL